MTLPPLIEIQHKVNGVQPKIFRLSVVQEAGIPSTASCLKCGFGPGSKVASKVQSTVGIRLDVLALGLYGGI